MVLNHKKDKINLHSLNKKIKLLFYKFERLLNQFIYNFLSSLVVRFTHVLNILNIENLNLN